MKNITVSFIILTLILLLVVVFIKKRQSSTRNNYHTESPRYEWTLESISDPMTRLDLARTLSRVNFPLKEKAVEQVKKVIEELHSYDNSTKTSIEKISHSIQISNSKVSFAVSFLLNHEIIKAYREPYLGSATTYVLNLAALNNLKNLKANEYNGIQAAK